MFTSKEGPSIRHFIASGHVCRCLPFSWALPDLAGAFLNYARNDFEAIAEDLKKNAYDLILTNTITSLHGILLANRLDLPHITYVHEQLAGDPDHLPAGISAERFVAMHKNESAHLLCCSEFVKANLALPEKTTVIYPCSYAGDATAPAPWTAGNPELNLIVIGTKSTRKNTHFAVTILKALRMRNHKAALHILGGENTGSNKLQRQVKIRQEPDVFNYPADPAPYAKLDLPRRLTLVCSTTETFGLTIVESLKRAIPVVASRCGGPNELLEPGSLFDVDNVEQCVRCIERVLDDYDAASRAAVLRWQALSARHSPQSQTRDLEASLLKARSGHAGGGAHMLNDHLLRNVPLFSKIAGDGVPLECLSENISKVAEGLGLGLSPTDVVRLIGREKLHPGSAVLEDLHRFDAVPFGPSKNMERLGTEGIGRAIESAAEGSTEEKIRALAVILLSLLEASESRPGFRVLVVGGGLGVDAIKIASCGFPVDLFNPSASSMEKVARLNVDSVCRSSTVDIRFVDAILEKYAAVICLDVIDSVEDVFHFLRFLKDAVKPSGLLYLTENFNGIGDRRPTALYQNERYSTLLPLLLAADFDLCGYNRNPLFKPYLFRRNPSPDSTAEKIHKPFNEQLVVHAMHQSRTNIGF